MKKLAAVTIAATLTLTGCGSSADVGLVSTTATSTAQAVGFDRQEVINTCVAGINAMETNMNGMGWLTDPEVGEPREGGDYALVSGLATIETLGQGWNKYDISCMVNVKGDVPDLVFGKAEPRVG